MELEGKFLIVEDGSIAWVTPSDFKRNNAGWMFSRNSFVTASLFQ